MIKENTLSEADVKKIVAENSSGETSGSDTDWADGTELKMLSSQNLPYSENGITIEKIAVRKYHYNGERDGRPQKYKYTLEVEGSIPDYDSSRYVAEFHVNFLSSHGYESRTSYYFYLQNLDAGDAKMTYFENNGKFVFTAEEYGIYGDYDEYWIDRLVLHPDSF